MSAAKRFRYVVLCPDKAQRHSGSWSEPGPAKRYAERPRCCSEMGRHDVVQRRALPARGRQLSGQGFT